MGRLALGGWIVLIISCPLLAPAQSAKDEITLFHNAIFYTCASGNAWTAEAMAVQDDRIAAVGTVEELEARCEIGRRIDLQGRFVYPGFIDAHGHLLGMGLSSTRIDLAGCESIDEALERMRKGADSSGDWLVGRGWDQTRWPEKEFPHAGDLDRVFPDRPVWMVRIDGHAGWANSKALRLAGVGADTPDPNGGRILRDSKGEATGILLDAAMDRVNRRIPAPDLRRKEAALERALLSCASCGLTGVHEPGANWATIDLYRRFIEEGRFTLRVYVMLEGTEEEVWHDERMAHIPLGCSASRLTVRAVKFYMDGALGSRGAALIEEYCDDPGNRGILTLDEAGIRSSIRRAAAHGLQPCVHAIGDRANRMVLDAFEFALTPEQRIDLRPRIEHAQVVAIEDIPRFAKLGVIASMQPTHAASDMDWAQARVGPERIRGAYAWRTIAESGAKLAGGSDFPIEGVNPLLGFYAAVTRQDEEGWPEGGWRPQERLTREQALLLFTRDAAYAGFAEKDQGSLEPGKLADFTVLDRDIMAVPAREILSSRILQTYVGGAVVWDSREEKP